MEAIYVVAVIIFLCLFVIIKYIIWDVPREKVKSLESEIDNIKNNHKKELLEVHKKCQDKIQKLENSENEAKLKYQKIYLMLKKLESNITAIPYMAGMIADIETYELEKLALGLEWGYSQKRLNKVKSIREIRENARAMVEKNKYAQYQLAYLLELIPNLTDIIECDFDHLPPMSVSELSNYDSSRDYLSKEEYELLTTTQRNQLALDRYNSSKNKTKWQIGRDYEQYVGYQYRKMGYDVDNYGTYMGIEDLGRDIIAKKDRKILIIQCKYWSKVKLIQEKHITQLYGTVISYCVENRIDQSRVKGVLVTNIQLSEMAKKIASFLGIEYIENNEIGEYPCIKCNIARDEYGITKIYHLPFDRQYDVTKIKKSGEFYAMTVAEAEAAGFRRTFKWFGEKRRYI